MKSSRTSVLNIYRMLYFLYQRQRCICVCNVLKCRVTGKVEEMLVVSF